MLIADLRRHVEYLEQLPAPLPQTAGREGFRH
jgi:hypothetical protein